MKYCSVDRLSDFEYHDAWFSLISWENGTLIVKAECLNIHRDADQNPFDTDMEIELARITFSNFRVIFLEKYSSVCFDDKGEKISEKPSVVYTDVEAETLFRENIEKEFKVGYLEAKKDGVYWLENLTDPSYMGMTFDSACIEWDSYLKPAWYVNKD